MLPVFHKIFVILGNFKKIVVNDNHSQYHIVNEIDNDSH